MKLGLRSLATKTDRQVYTVSELTSQIRDLLEGHFPTVWVEGEVSNFKYHSSGHMYFSLKDETSQMQCVMFRSDNARLDFELKDGLQVVCFGRVGVYTIRGQYQLYVERIEPKGLGALQLKFLQLKEKLKNEGLFDEQRKRKIPFLPRRIGVVTSKDGAALQDILKVLSRRYQNAQVLVYPVPVQGEGAAPLIAEAIDDLNAGQCVDVLIVGRGGGSLEDLWAFNEEVVARAIYRSTIPVISAVGHEVDFTIADFVADLRAPTPSAAAELVLPLREDLVARIVELRSRACQASLSLVKGLRQDLDNLLDSPAIKDPLAIFETQFQRLDELRKSSSVFWETIFQTKREGFLSLLGKLKALGPLATLERGFSVTVRESDGKVVTSFDEVKKGELLKTKLSRGFLISQVKETHA